MTRPPGARFRLCLAAARHRLLQVFLRHLRRRAENFVGDSQLPQVEQPRRVRMSSMPPAASPTASAILVAHIEMRQACVSLCFWFGQKILEDHQHSVVAVFDLPRRFRIALVDSPDGVIRQHQHSAPQRQVEPAHLEGSLHPPGKDRRIHDCQQYHSHHARNSSERCVPPPIVTRGKQRRKKIRYQGHPLPRGQNIQPGSNHR